VSKWVIKFDDDKRCPANRPEQFHSWCAKRLLEGCSNTDCPGLGKPGCPAKKAREE